MVRGQQNVSRVQRRAWHGSILLALVLSLLPARWLLGWTSDVAQLVRFPLVPLQHAASGVRQWLRPVPDPRAAEPEALQRLEADLEQARTAYKRLELEREDLWARIATLEKTREAAGGDAALTIYAVVIAIQPPTARSIGTLTINAGSRAGVTPGMVATWDGDIVIGRTADTADRFTGTVIPISSLSGFAVRFFPPDREIPASQAPGGVLRATGAGGWTVDLTQPGEIAEGWVGRIADESWPAATRGMRVCVVAGLGTRDDAPLVKRLDVRPAVDPYRLPHVVLVTDAPPVDAAGRGGSR